MKLLTERPNYDFKLELPDNKKMSKEACALANMKGGGLILLGIDNQGNVKGIPRASLDDAQQWCGNIILTTCTPKPDFEFQVFDVPEDPEKCVLILRISEVDRKPCMAYERVYTRVGSPDARPAGPDEIRRLVLGSD